jgi:acyl-CoA reductase-like NAD-dependent aldehyde dehydrogenase
MAFQHASGYLETISPTYNEAITTAPVADAGDADSVVQEAHAAFPAWAATPRVERRRYLRLAAPLAAGDTVVVKSRDQAPLSNASQHFMGAPFGGVKQSGIGREECFAELMEFTYTKNVNLKLG